MDDQREKITLYSKIENIATSQEHYIVIKQRQAALIIELGYFVIFFAAEFLAHNFQQLAQLHPLSQLYHCLIAPSVFQSTIQSDNNLNGDNFRHTVAYCLGGISVLHFFNLLLDFNSYRLCFGLY